MTSLGHPTVRLLNTSRKRIHANLNGAAGKKITTGVWLSVIAALVIAREYALGSRATIALAILCALLFVLLDESSTLAILVFLVPLASLVPLTQLVWLALLMTLIKRWKFIRLPIYSVVLVVGIFLLEASSGFLTAWSLSEFLKFAGYMLLVLLICSDRREAYRHADIVNAFIGGVLVAGTVLIVGLVKAGRQGELLHPTDRLGKQSELAQDSILATNPNSLAISALLVIALSLTALLLLRRFAYLVVLPPAVLLGFLTASRTFLIGVAMLVGVLVLVSLFRRRWRGRGLAILLVLLVVVWAPEAVAPGYYDFALSRITDAEDVTNGRALINGSYLELTLSSTVRLLFGSGMQGYRRILDQDYSVHSAGLELLVMWGLVGCVLVVLLFRQFLRNGFRGPSGSQDTFRRLVSLVPSCAYLVALQGSHGFAIWANILLLIVCYSSLRYLASDPPTNRYGSAHVG